MRGWGPQLGAVLISHADAGLPERLLAPVCSQLGERAEHAFLADRCEDPQRALKLPLPESGERKERFVSLLVSVRPRGSGAGSGQGRGSDPDLLPFPCRESASCIKREAPTFPLVAFLASLPSSPPPRFQLPALWGP